ncbi:MAG: hypothetical protein N3H31_01975 [Candidatus Nezhaarchaeota archaeon]|nr:hypothetical protein [Candidatus Nezhaarchaeota archaeon]
MMSRMIDTWLRGLSTIIHRMSDLAHQSVSMAIDECLHGVDSYSKIREASSTLILLADQVEDGAFEAIARFQPVASDLRIIKAYMKISYDLVRFGRYALDISYVNKRLGGLKEGEEWIRSYVADMSNKVMSMVKESVEALRSAKIEAASKVSEMEKAVDKLYLDFLSKIIEEKDAKSKIVTSSVLIIRYLERIADHAIYLYESIIYMLTGRREFLR